MYLAATRSIVSNEAKQLKPWILQLQYKVRSEPELPGSRSYKHLAKCSKVSTKKIPLLTFQKPFLHFPVTESTDTTSNTTSVNTTEECTPYSVSLGSLGPFVDSRHWFAEKKDDDEEIKDSEDSEYTKPETTMKSGEESLEAMRKRINLANQKYNELLLDEKKKK